MLDPVARLEEQFLELADDKHCASAKAAALGFVSMLLPPEDISTKECAAKYRYLPNPEGDGKRLYDRELTPYMDGPQDALDDPLIPAVIVPGPGRTGKSIAGENHLFKRLRNGPLTDTIIYLPAKGDVDSYADKEFADFFSLHPEIAVKVGRLPKDNKRMFKRVAGKSIQLFPANPGNVRQKQAPLIMATEVDGYRATLRAAFRNLAEVRGRAYGNQFKLYLESHADAGWTGGIALFWLDSSRGIWFWPCPHCEDWSSPHPLAPKGMLMRLVYDRDDTLDDDENIELADKSAALACPHCGSLITDDHKRQMNIAGKWVHTRWQTITPDGTVTGPARKAGVAAGFWIHGTMSPFVKLGELARKWLQTTIHFERTRKPQPLREFTAKELGEVYEGAGGAGRVLDPKRLQDRAKDEEINPPFKLGLVPEDVLFLTAAVDVGGKKFDVLITGWDLEGRSWLIDRYTIFQGGEGRELRPPERQKDWLVIRDRLLRTLVPLEADPKQGMPIACVAIDTGGSGNLDGDEPGGVTWKAREFARQMARSGDSGRNGYRLMLIKGGGVKKAPEVGAAREINKDAEGKPMLPAVKEFTLNVDKLKMLSVERLLVDDAGPGQVAFAKGLPKAAYDELCGEALVDGKWERRGANETLDLFGYCEAARIQLQPERSDIKWETRRPVWARPVPLEEGNPIAAKPKSALAKESTARGRLAQLNRR
jgi:phage terminase large subunit GpA-like protein